MINNEPGRRNGRTAIQAAAGCDQFKVANYLWSIGSNVNDESGENGGRTALQAAVEAGDLRMIGLLLDHGADVNAPSEKLGGLTALQIARYESRHDIEELLREREAKE